MADTTEIPVWGDELEDWMNIGTSAAPEWCNVTNLLSWEFDDDQDTYEPEYIDTTKRPVYVRSKSASIEYEKDLYRNNKLDAFLVKNEDNTNIAVQVCRIRTWETGTNAKMANFLLTPSQLDKNTAGEPVKLKGTLSMNDPAWTAGTFDSTKGFTEVA